MEELADRVEALQHQVGELAERQDFAERLLAKAREKGLPAGEAQRDAGSESGRDGADRRPDLRMITAS